MNVWFSSYQLVAQQQNPQLQKNKYRKGALLRVRFSNDLIGFSDLCPYPEMGDHPIEVEMKQILMKKPSELANRSFEFARMDAEARRDQKSLYQRDCKIKNHFLITDLLNFDLDRLTRLESSGYSEFKIKLGRDLIKETKLLEHITNRISAGSKLRLDFNASLNRDRFTDWFEKSQKWLRPFLDFIEDPFTYNAKDWREVSSKWNIPFALDLAGDPISSNAEGASTIVIKPAVQNADEIIEHFKDSNKKFVFTHYMDFAVGQMYAYVMAQKYSPRLGRQLQSCGLQSCDLYNEMTFQQKIQYDGPYIIPPDGFGIGFDKMLEQLSWTEIF